MILVSPNLCSRSADSFRLPLTCHYPVSLCQLHLWTISFPCQVLQPNREFCPSPCIILKCFQCAKFFRKKWKYKTCFFLKLNHSGLHFFFVKTSCQLKTFVEGVGEEFCTPIAFPLPPHYYSFKSSIFDTIEKIHFVNLDLNVPESAIQTTLASKFCFNLASSAQFSHIWGFFLYFKSFNKINPCVLR